MNDYFGIDFANKKANHGECLLRDDNKSLTAYFRDRLPEGARRKKTAVDCPFGTSKGFEALLRGEACVDLAEDGFKTRVTERLLRDRVGDYDTNEDWRTRSKADRKLYPRASYFNGGSHIQPAIGMVIVPALLYWLGNEVAEGKPPAERLAEIKAARRGEGRIVEAHPRMYLYSAVERVRRAKGQALPLKTLNAIAGYKADGAEGEDRRRAVFRFLKQHTEWCGPDKARELKVDGGENELVEVDHAFDAWLSALTAWSHDLGETWTWKESQQFDRDTVDIEGHILILR